jgi:hypothetical protein
MFDGHYDLGDDEDDAKELPVRTSVLSRSSKQCTQVGLSKRDAVLKSEVRSLFYSFFVSILLTYKQ